MVPRIAREGGPSGEGDGSPGVTIDASEKILLMQHATQAPTWLTYTQAALYTGWSVGHLRNLVSAGQIPVYGRARVRRFRRDMLDLYLTNPDMAMRTFLAERNEPYGR